MINTMDNRRQLQALNAKIALVSDYKRTLEEEVSNCITELQILSESRRELLNNIEQKV